MYNVLKEGGGLFITSCLVGFWRMPRPIREFFDVCGERRKGGGPLVQGQKDQMLVVGEFRQNTGLFVRSKRTSRPLKIFLEGGVGIS